MTIRSLIRISFAVLLLTFVPFFAGAHDLPKQRVDRTVQLRFEPELLNVDYTLELDDATIARDLKRLNDRNALPPDPDEWLDEYGRLVAPLIASALKLDRPDTASDAGWEVVDIDRRREIHTIYTFRFRIRLTRPGNYRFRDTNFATSEGISRLGALASAGVESESEGEYPVSAADQPYRPAWMLDEIELRKTVEWSGKVRWNNAIDTSDKRSIAWNEPETRSIEKSSSRFWPARLGFLSATLLGVLHTLQPGHGKTLLAAASISSVRRRNRGFAIAAGWVISHFAVIFFLAALTLILSESSLLTVSISLTKIAGFLLACPAAYRIGERMRSVASELGNPNSEIDFESASSLPESNSNGSSGFFLGLTAGIIPCWEAIGLLLLGISAGHIMTGLALVAAFMAGSLVVVIASIYAAQWISAILSSKRKSSQFLMIGLDMVVLATGAGFLLASTSSLPFGS